MVADPLSARTTRRAEPHDVGGRDQRAPEEARDGAAVRRGAASVGARPGPVLRRVRADGWAAGVARGRLVRALRAVGGRLLPPRVPGLQRHLLLAVLHAQVRSRLRWTGETTRGG